MHLTMPGSPVQTSCSPIRPQVLGLHRTCADSVGREKGNENAHAEHDTGAASANMCLQATALGLYMHGMAGFDKARATENFNLPSDYAPVTVWALGHMGEADLLPVFLQQMEAAPRARRHLSEFVFTDWEKAAEI